MSGFKAFVMRGNLVELAVAFIMATSFTAVVTALVKVVLEVIVKVGGSPDFDRFRPAGLISVGPFLTALVSFVLLAAIVYFFLVKPYEFAKARFDEPEVDPAPNQDIVLLTEIRDLLARKPS